MRLSFLGHRNYLLATFYAIVCFIGQSAIKKPKIFSFDRCRVVPFPPCEIYVTALAPTRALCQRRLLSRTFTFVLHFLWAIWSWPCGTARSWRLFHSSLATTILHAVITHWRTIISRFYSLAQINETNIAIRGKLTWKLHKRAFRSTLLSRNNVQLTEMCIYEAQTATLQCSKSTSRNLLEHNGDQQFYFSLTRSATDSRKPTRTGRSCLVRDRSLCCRQQ